MTIDQWFTIIQTDERFSSVCISKVNYWNIEKRVPKLNEWCRYTDIGNKFGNGILTINDYTEVEDSYVSCLKQIARKCGCSFLYVRGYSSTCEESENLKGVKVSINHIDSIFRESFRDNNSVILYNMSNNLLIEFYTDLVCSVFSLLKENELNAIVREYGLFCIQSSEFHHIDTYLNKLLDADYKPEKRFVIVKYNPRYYDEEKYLRNEWTSIADVGLTFDDGILTMEDYIRVENNYISCIKEIVEATGCKKLMVGFIEGHYRLKIKKANNEIRYVYPRSLLNLKDIDDVLKKVIREEEWVVLINKSKGVMIDFGYDLYLHIRCNLEIDKVRKIVKKNNLFFDPRNQMHNKSHSTGSFR